MAHLRGHLIYSTKGIKAPKEREYTPSRSLAYEDAIAEYACELFTTILKRYQFCIGHLMSSYTTTISQDEELLKNQELDYPKRFAVTRMNLSNSKIVLRLGHKKIAYLQSKLFKLLTLIIGGLKKKLTLKEAYMTTYPEIDEDNEGLFHSNRKMIKNYLKALYDAGHGRK